MAQPAMPASEPTRQKSFFRDTLEIVFLALALYLVIQYAVQTVHVLGSSMLPTLENNDLLVASKISYKLHQPQRGDIIVFRPPTDNSRDFIKRVIALPGDQLRIENGVVYINGEVLNEPYLNGKWTQMNTWNEGNVYIVPPGHYFVMGDNRNFSSDSRSFGAIDESSILGKAEIRIWPLQDVGLLGGHPSLVPAP